jgi:uncharacterized protein (DUF1330 family)
MRQAVKFTLTVLAGFALGAGAIEGLHAQGEVQKPAYVVAEVQVTDPPTFQDYAKKATAVLKTTGGTLLVPPGSAETKEGAPVTGKIVIIRFGSLADAEKWYNEPPYHPLIAERQRAAKTRLYIVEGAPQ